MIHLTRRERSLAVGLAAVVGIWSLYAAAIKPARDRIRALGRIIPEKRSELRDVQAMSTEYATLCRRLERFRATAAAQDPNFQLLPHLEKLVERHGLARNMTRMAPGGLQGGGDYAGTVVEIELQSVSLKQLIALIQAIEASEVLTQVASLHFRRGLVDPALLDSTIEIRSPRLDGAVMTADSKASP